MKPEKIVTLSFNAASATDSSLKVKSRPTVSGKKRFSFTPQPQNHVPKRVGIGDPVAAIASPLPSRNRSRQGSATATDAPRSIPLITLRRFQLDRDIDILLRADG